MGNIKKHNGQDWEVFGSSEASEIAVRSPKILQEEESAISVEEALERVEDTLDKHDKNIAWLTKYGGGGSGSGGGGGTILEATGTLHVNGLETGNDIIMDSNGLTISLDDVPAAITKAWSISIRIGAVKIRDASITRTSNVLYISSGAIAAALVNHYGLLHVHAEYADDINAVYGSASWDGDLYESVVNLSTANVETSLIDVHSKEIIYNYSVGYLGDTSTSNYRFSAVLRGNNIEYTYSTDLIILDTGEHDLRIPLTNMFPSGTVFEGNENLIGVYEVVATLQAISNAKLNATAISNVTIASENILIATTYMSPSKTSPKQVSLDGNLNIQFTAYVQGMTDFTYTVFLAEDKDLIYSDATKNQFTQIASGNGQFGVQVNASIAVTGKSWAIEDEDKEVVIYLLVTSGTKSASAHYYVEFVEAENSLLEEETSVLVSKVFDFEARLEDEGENVFSYSNSSFEYGSQRYPLTSQMETLNGNDLSRIRTIAGARSLRLSNGAAAYVHSFNFNNRTRGFSGFFSKDSTGNEFTISICFKADYHADDTRTILFCGAVDTQKTIINEETGQEEPNPNYMNISSGVSIDVHNIYINKEAVCPLSDNTINMVDIVGEKTTDDISVDDVITKRVRYVFKVYLNGVLSSIKEPNNDYMHFGDQIYLGCRQMIDNGVEKLINLCDCDIYDLKVYTKALNDFEIVKNYINNKARVSYKYNSVTDTYNLDYKVIDDELRKNFCSRDSDNNIESLLYKNETYTIDFLLNGDNLDEQKLNDYAKALSIPIMLIDVSGASSWTFNNFVQQQSAGQVSLGTAEGQRIQYWDPNGSYSRVVTLQNASIKLQGTSTLENAVKNVDITVPNDTVFIPKSTWLPEQTYTLKSDVIDSSHSNNAAIGYFINTVLGAAENQGEGAYYPFNEVAKDNVYNSDYVKNQQPTATLKHTVEGFPIFLIMKFATDTTSTVSVTPLGIYSFNLGRNAFRNLGFKKVNKITFGGSDAIEHIEVFPFVETAANIVEEDSNANWIEIDGTSEMNISQVTDRLPENFDSSHGDFWQNSNNILHNRYSVRYPSGKYTEEYGNFKNLVGSIMQLPIEGVSTTNVMGTVNIPQIASSYTAYTCSSDGTDYVPTGQQIQMSTDYNNFTGLTSLMNYDSFYKYFVIGMLFGLVDNFGKNSTYRSWNSGAYYMGFYDLDTALQNDNQGKLDIDPDTWFKYIYNKQDGDNPFGYMAETEDPSISITKRAVSAYSSKLWLSLDTPTARAAFAGGAVSGSNYTSYWYGLRNKLQVVANQAGYEDFVDYFVDEFFEKQTGECGSLIFNYDYKLKYLLQFTGNAYTKDDDLSRLHGRKIASTREWLKKRLIFLDSIFYWRDTKVTPEGFRTNLFSMGNNNVYNTPSGFPMKTNTSLVMYNQVGTNAQTYYFMKRNVSTLVNMASNASNSIVSWNFSHSPNVIEIGGEDYPLSSMNISTLSHADTNANWDKVGYPSITELNLANSKKLGSTSPLVSFHAGDALKDRTSELRVIDLSNTEGSQFTLANDLITITELGTSTDFSKLTKIDIGGSKCVTDIAIPPVPLKELNVAGSTINKFELENQAYLTNVNLSNCTSLREAVFRNCSNYGNFNISNLGSLATLTIANCLKMKSITITSCGALSKISIQQNPALESITIKNCPSLKGTSAVNFITITDCPLLTSIDFSDNSNLESFTIETSNEANITNLILTRTKVTHIGGNNRDNSLVDLRDFVGLQRVSFYGNTAVQYIRFANISDKPIPLTTTFQGCNNLLRIYGHVKVMVRAIFQNCTKFSIHGTQNIKFNNLSVMDGGRFMMPYEVLGVSVEDFEGVGLQPNAGNTLVTNMDFGIADASYDFDNTAVTTFDVYYVFSNTPNVTDYTYTFARTKNPFYWNKTEDNSPNRYMFRWATKLQVINNCFYGASADKGNVIRLFTPSRDGDTIGTDGLFSSVVDTLASLSTAFYSWYIVTDRYLFRHPTKDFSKITNFNLTNIIQLYDNINEGTYNDLVPTKDKIKAKFDSNDYSDIGNWTDFFKQMKTAPITVLGHITSTNYYIDYNTLKGLPNNIQRITGSFCSIYGSGEMNLKEFMSSRNKLQAVTNSFRVSARYALTSTTELRVDMPITDDFFEGFTSLINVGHAQVSGPDWDINDSSSATNCLSSSFMGYGIHKYINQETFPYRLLEPCMRTIQVFSGFFEGLEEDDNSPMHTVPALPGTLFYDENRSINASKLRRAGALFMNLNIRYTLSSGGFTACTNLNDVSYMFAADSSVQTPDTLSNDATAVVRKNYGEGCIPEELFYHGKGVDSPITYKGIVGNVESVDGNYKVMPEGSDPVYMTVIDKVVHWYSDEEMTVETTSPVQTVVVNFKNVNRKITKINHCFLRGNFSQYERELHNDSSDYEANDRYQPLDWIFDGIRWQSASATKNLNLYTDMWKYDGDSEHKTRVEGVENLDVAEDFDISTIDHPVAGQIGGTKYFMCAPDLLRYCSPSCDLSYLFALSGHNCHSSVYGNGISNISGDKTYGIKGRIVPWFLYPFKDNVTISLDGIFQDCKMLSAYKLTSTSRVYIIPEKLFSWCPNVASMSYTFSGLIFPTGNNLEVFGNISNKLTNISYIFYRPLFIGSPTIENVFNSFTNLNNITGAFAISVIANEQSAFAYDQKVKFSSVFKSNTYNTEKYKTNDLFRYAFAGYNNTTDPASGVFGNKTLVVGNSRFNYMRYNGIEDS